MLRFHQDVGMAGRAVSFDAHLMTSAAVPAPVGSVT
jgi:hypothetical protein